MVGEVRDEQLYKLVVACVDEGRTKILELREQRGWLPTQLNFPVAGSPYKAGFPSFSEEFSSNVVDYDRAFGVRRSDWTPIAYGDLAHFADLVEHVRSVERLRQYYMITEPLDKMDSTAQSFFLIEVSWIPLRILDRALHLHGDDFSEGDLRPIYEEIEAGIFETELPVEIVIPIPLTHFALDGRHAMDGRPGVAIERMSDEWQLARQPRGRYGLSATAHPIVIEAATHSLVLSNYMIPNPISMAPGRERIDFYPIDKIEQFFESLRLATGAVTGFTQVAMRPIGWAHGWLAHLPAAMPGIFVRRYPSVFDDWYWVREPPAPITNDELAHVALVDAALAASASTVRLAARRHSSAVLRDSEEDAMIDLCIGLEAALGDESPQEATHKLALRTAAVMAAFAGSSPEEVYVRTRKIYGYRSAIVHGHKKPAKNRTIAAADGSTVASVDVARDYLRAVILALLANEEWQRPAFVDATLILATLGGDNRKAPAASQ